MQNFSDSEIEVIKTFTCLGLTKNQARIYLTLTQFGRSTVKQISNCSKIAREEVYRICPKLVDLGIINKIITSPIRFEATPIEKGLSLLIKRRTREINDLRIKAKIFVENAKRFNKIKADADLQWNNSRFILIPKREALIRNIKQSIDGAEKSVLIVTSIKRHPRAVYVYERELNKALSRGVKFRVIVGEIKKGTPEIAKKFEEHPLTSVRYLSSPSTAVMVLIDNSKGFVMTAPTAELKESPALQIENRSLLRLLQEYFEYVWSTATEENET